MSICAVEAKLLCFFSGSLKVQLSRLHTSKESNFALSPFGVNKLLNWRCLQGSCVTFLHFTLAVLSLQLVSTPSALIILSPVIDSLENCFCIIKLLEFQLTILPSTRNSQRTCNDATQIASQRDNSSKALGSSWKWFRNGPESRWPETRRESLNLNFSLCFFIKPKSEGLVFSNVTQAASTELESDPRHPWAMKIYRYIKFVPSHTIKIDW